jgi:hypothetical protein
MAEKILTIPQISVSDKEVFAACSGRPLNQAMHCLGKPGSFLDEFSAIFGITSTVLGFQTQV